MDIPPLKIVPNEIVLWHNNLETKWYLAFINGEVIMKRSHSSKEELKRKNGITVY